MRDVTARVLNNLLGREDELDLRHLKDPCIIIAHDLTPSNTAQLDRKNVLGFGTDVGSKTSHTAITDDRGDAKRARHNRCMGRFVGSKTSHTAIMARSLRIPAVVGLKSASSQLKNGQYVLLDGFKGVIIADPTDQSLYEYGQLVRKQLSLEEKLRDLLLKPA